MIPAVPADVDLSRCSPRRRFACHSRAPNVQSSGTLEEVEELPAKVDEQLAANQRVALSRLWALIQLLKPLDRQVIISYLEGIEAASTSEITGLSAENVAMRIHRIENVLAKWFREGGKNA